MLYALSLSLLKIGKGSIPSCERRRHISALRMWRPPAYQVSNLTRILWSRSTG